MNIVKKMALVNLVVALLCASGYSASRVVLDHIEGAVWYDTGDTVLNRNCPVKFVFRLINTDGVSVKGFSNGFQVYTKRNGTLTSSYSPVIADTIPIGWNNYMDGGVFINKFGVNGNGIDTVGFSGFALVENGFPDGFDALVWNIVTTPTVDEDTLCVDSTFFPPNGSWLWGTSAGTIVPEWGGPYCYRILLCPCGWTVFDNCPSTITATYGSTVQDTIYAHNSIYPQLPVQFVVFDGPGSISSLSDTSAVWSYQPTIHDTGSVRTVMLTAYSEGSCGSCDFTVHITTEPPYFTGGCDDTVQTDAGGTATHTVTTNVNPEYIYINSVHREPSGSYSIDNGVITFTTSSNDRGLYTFEVCVAFLADTVCCPVTFFVTDSVCLNRGNVDGVVAESRPVDVSDLTYLVAYLFQGGTEPPCIEEGNVDAVIGSGGPVDVADLTYLVAYLFQGGDAPPVCP